MRVLLVSANTEQINMRTLPWGLWCVASAARQAGHQVSVVDLMEASDPAATVAAAVQAAEPQLIGISVRNIDDQQRAAPTFLLAKVRAVVEACRASSTAPLLLGGAGYSIFPEAALDYLGADLGIQGEGEQAFPELLRVMERGEPLSQVPGLFLRGRGAQAPRSFLGDLDPVPLPDRACLDQLPASDPARPLWVPLQSRRGCPLGCAYCSTATIEGTRVRRRSPAVLIEWLAAHPQVSSRPLYFVDNNFNVPLAAGKELCRAILASGLRLRWRCIFNPRDADPELIELMAEAGCSEVSIGHEAGSEPMLQALHKSFSLEQVRRAAALLGRAGIRRMGFLLLGGPGETRQTALQSLRFTDELGLESIKVTRGIRIYPDTPLAELALREGQLRPDQDLLRPHFYFSRELEESWLEPQLADWCASRPHWLR